MTVVGFVTKGVSFVHPHVNNVKVDLSNLANTKMLKMKLKNRC